MNTTPKPRSFRNATFVATAALALLGGLWLRQSSPAAVVAPVAGEAAAPVTTAGTAPAEPPETYRIACGGQPHTLRLALDEAMLRDADGKGVIQPLVPPATLATLPARLASLAAPGGVFPVAYPDGEVRSDATRRIVTRDLRLQADEPAATQLAASHRLTIKDRPAYAPGWLVLSAADPFAALDAMTALRGRPGVAAADVLLAVQHTRKSLPNDPLITAQWHSKNTNSIRTHANLETAWNYGGTDGVKGAGIRIGIVDDGLETTHPDLATNVDTFNDYDWNGGGSDPNPGTGDDHGTSCAGNAAARGNNGTGVSGTAPEATLVGLRLIAANVTDAQEAEAMAYRNDIIQVKSNSWGPNDTGNILEGPGPLTIAALESATTSGRGGKGTVILWAGGNGGDVGDNSNYDGYANSIHTLAIGATDSTGLRAYYSEPGSNLVVCAPSSGNGAALGITTVDRSGSLGYNAATSANGGDYASDFGGTSSATPTAAGIVALMLEKNPNLGWRDVKEVLIRSAYKFKPADSGWATNGAGLSFHHDFGAGLIDATAAVNLAATWTNLAAPTSAVSTQSGLTVAIPDNNATGVTRSFNLSATAMRVEHATVRLSISHTSRGNLEITLTSPSGMVSRLAAVHSDTNDNYADWTFSSVRHWGESATGNWTLKIADRSTSGNSTGGTLTAAELTLFGTPVAPINPPPLVQITQPTAGQVFSPGASVTVEITAADLTAAGTPGTITQVELMDYNVSVGTDTVAPYSFTFAPATGSHTLVAKATDSEAAVGTSASVTFSVVNQAPQITAVGLTAINQEYADVLVTASYIATDPEGAPLAAAYQWQSSSDGVSFSNAPGITAATLPADATHAAKLWRCVVTVSDGENSSVPATTAAINLLLRPISPATTGMPYSYASGLVLRGTDSPVSRAAMINEFSQGSGTAEWVEILTLQTASFRGWSLADSSTARLTFADAVGWDAIPAGTLIVIYNGAAKDTLLPADDSDPADGRLVLSSSNPAFFSGVSPTWPSLGNSGDALVLRDPAGIAVSQLSYGTTTAFPPNLGSVGSSQAAYYAGGDDAGATTAANWVATTATVARKPNSRATGELSISEYVEGTSNNKAIEIYNPSAAAVDLATGGYKLELYNNGAATVSYSLNLAGTIAAGGTFVIKNILASALIIAQQPWNNLLYNGDDAIVLKKGATVIDCFGQVGYDPGTAWTANGVTTVDKSLRRKPAVSQGDAITNDPFDPSVEWLQFATDDFSGLGSHTIDQAAVGVTPAAANTAANQTFVTALRDGSLDHSALFRLGAAAQVPAGLALDPVTGILAGTLSAAAGNYLIVIERYNTLGEVVSQAFTLTIIPSAATTYATWIAGYSVGALTGVAQDADGDGIANGIENLLGTRPDLATIGLTQLAANPGILVFQHSRSNIPASDLIAAYEWSADMQTWYLSGQSAAGTTVTFGVVVTTDVEAPANDWVTVTATATGTIPPRLFARLRATQTH